MQLPPAPLRPARGDLTETAWQTEASLSVCVRVYVSLFIPIYICGKHRLIYTQISSTYMYIHIYTYIYRVCTLVVDSLGKASSKLGDSGKHLKLYVEYYLRPSLINSLLIRQISAPWGLCLWRLIGKEPEYTHKAAGRAVVDCALLHHTPALVQ